MERLIHAQTLTINTKQSSGHGNAIWAMNFSPDGKYLAAVGQDHVIRIWKVRDGAQAVEQQDQYSDGQHSHHSNRDIGEEHMSINVFDQEPVKEFTGHTDDILALRWSKVIYNQAQDTHSLTHGVFRITFCYQHLLTTRSCKYAYFISCIAYQPLEM